MDETINKKKSSKKVFSPPGSFIWKSEKSFQFAIALQQ